MGSRRKSMKRSKNLERGEGSRSKVIPWDELPFDILENIMTMVYHGDQVNIRRVCKNWNVKGEVPPLKQFPWLIDFTDNNSWGSFKMVNPYDNHKIYDVNVRDRRLCGKSLEDVHVHECKKGWFLMSKAKHFKTNDTSLFLFSPFFKCEIIELPDLRFPFTLVSFSSNPRDENCAYFALHVSHRIPTSVVIGTCTKKDRMWSRLSFECDSHMSYDFRSVVYIEQECSFYCLAQNGSIGIYNIAEQSWRVEQYEVKLISPRGVHDHPRLIQSQGHVLMVDIVPKSTDCSTWNVPNYAIYSLDKQTSKWKRLDEMKSEVFFLGGCSAAIPATWGSNTSIPTTSGGNRVFYSSGTKIKQFVFSDTRRYCDTRSHPCQVYYGPSVVKLGETGRMTFIEAPQ